MLRAYTSGTQATSAVKRLDFREFSRDQSNKKKTPIECMFCSENGLSTDTYAVNKSSTNLCLL